MLGSQGLRPHVVTVGSRKQHPVHTAIDPAPPQTGEEAKGRRKQREKIFCRNDERSWPKYFLYLKYLGHVLTFWELFLPTGRCLEQVGPVKSGTKNEDYPIIPKSKENAA